MTFLWRQAWGKQHPFSKSCRSACQRSGGLRRLLLQPTQRSPQHSPLPSPGRTPEPLGMLIWATVVHPAFQKDTFLLCVARISMEIETSFFRGPLLTSPSHISIGESVPGLCSEETGHIHPASWQVVPRNSHIGPRRYRMSNLAVAILQARLGCLRNSRLSNSRDY